jgi:para-nitrobenzyl esterase
MAIADTRSGKVEGNESEGIQVFKGIPYATPPVGNLRWRPPQPEAAWDGVRECTSFSAQSAQSVFAMTAMLGGGRPAYSEDSLYLNVWTPACDDAKRPVLFWIHGGAFIWGAADTSWYDGTHFAQHGDVVLVSINYRLGPFGFLHLADLYPELAGSGNLGLLDQIAALEWVRDCIGAFGGDPDQVTIFGESAGAASVATLLGTPAARGLFKGAISESGGASWCKTPADATAVAQELVDALDVPKGDLDALLAKTTDEIIEAMPAFTENGASSLPFAPVVDGAVLPELPLDAIRKGSADGVRVLAGTNANEMTLFVMADPAFSALDDDQIRERARTVIGDGDIVSHYRAEHPDWSAQELWTQIATDVVFWVPMVRLLEAQSGHGDTYAYFFSWATPVFGGLLKSTHALELPFVFDTLATPEAAFFTGTGEERQAIADAMHASWIAFARTGDPSNANLPDWPQYESGRRATMRFDTTLELLDDPARADREAFDQAGF